MYNLHMQQQQQQTAERKNFKQAKMKFMLHHRNFNGGGRHPTGPGVGAAASGGFFHDINHSSWEPDSGSCLVVVV